MHLIDDSSNLLPLWVHVTPGSVWGLNTYNRKVSNNSLEIFHPFLLGMLAIVLLSQIFPMTWFILFIKWIRIIIFYFHELSLETQYPNCCVINQLEWIINYLQFWSVPHTIIASEDLRHITSHMYNISDRIIALFLSGKDWSWFCVFMHCVPKKKVMQKQHEGE